MITIQNEREEFAFDDMIADFMTNKKFQTMINDLFFICRKFNTSLVFITSLILKFQKMSN